MKLKNSLCILVCLASLAQLADAAIINDPTLASGPGDVIDPPGSESVDVSNGTAETILEARSDLRVLQTFAGFEGGGNNIVNFTDSALPDIQFQLGGDFNETSSGSEGANELFATSAGSAMQLRNADTGDAPDFTPNSSTLTISFGTWDGSVFVADRTVSAAAFTMTQLYKANGNNKSGTVTFNDADGVPISPSFDYEGETGADGVGSGNHLDVYFGWDADHEGSASIGSITIVMNDARAEFTSGFDDLAFTVVPEDSSLALTGFTYDPATGDSEVSIEGEPSMPYILVEADDLDFTNPDQSPAPLTGATVGTLNGDQIITDTNGDATVQFNLGTAKPATFIRAESVPPPPPLLSEDFEGGTAN